jgi:hypothetical protein
MPLQIQPGWRSGSSLLTSSNCKPAVLGSNLAISPACSGLPSGMVLHERLFSEGRQRRLLTRKGFLVHQKQQGKKIWSFIIDMMYCHKVAA